MTFLALDDQSIYDQRVEWPTLYTGLNFWLNTALTGCVTLHKYTNMENKTSRK